MATQTQIDTSPFAAIAQKSWQVLLGVGLAEAVLGVIVLVWPGQTLSLVATLFGLFLIFSGIAECVLGISTPAMSGGYRFLNIITGVLSFILGVMCFRSELGSIALLGVWIGVGWIMTGFSRVFTFSSLPSMPGRGWAIAASVLSIIAGMIMVIYPISSVATLALFGGVSLAVIGLVHVFQAFQWRHTVKTL